MRRNVASAREGIDTTVTSASLRNITFVEMEHQPERALIHLLRLETALGYFKVEMEPQPERALIQWNDSLHFQTIRL